MYLPLFVGIACAVLFHRAAEYERMSPAVWVLSSIGLSVAISLLGGGLLWVILAQLGLFAAMWLYNARRPPRP